MPSFFSYESEQDYSYLLLGIYVNGEFHTASYNKSPDGEFITSISTGERFYNLANYVASFRGMNAFNEFLEVVFYDEEQQDWFPTEFLLKD
jgi:hypothetical protein